MNNNPIGVLDSGVGGLSIWQEIVTQLPGESTVYIGDSQNCPYGNRSTEQIYSLAKRLVEFLQEKQCKLIVVACNTITVSSLSRLRKEFPNIPMVGTVPVIKTAASVTRNRKIGVLSTSATSASQYQRDLINIYAKECEVMSIGTDRLVPLVEKGEIKGKEVESVVQQELWRFVKADIDTLALGCSHFPFLKKEIRKVLGENIRILDSAGAVARQVTRVLRAQDLFSDGSVGHFLYTTGDKGVFQQFVDKLVKVNSKKRSITHCASVALAEKE